MNKKFDKFKICVILNSLVGIHSKLLLVTTNLLFKIKYSIQLVARLLFSFPPISGIYLFINRC